MNAWKKKKLSDLSSNKDAIVSGPFGSNLKVSDYQDEGIPILRLQNVGKGYFINKDIKFISVKKANELKYHSFLPGDLVLAKLGIPVGKTCIIPNEFSGGIIVADVVRIRPDKSIVDFKFLEYFLNTDEAVEQLTSNISGATRPRVNLSDVRNIELHLPPLPEQQRIVAILDEAFDAIAKAKANAEQNLKNAKELFESYLQGVFEKKGYGWEEKTVDEICKEVTVGFVGKMANKYKDYGIPFLRSQNIKPHQISLKDVIYIDEEFNNELKKTQLSPGDLAIVRTGFPGTAAVIPKSLPISNCSDIVIIKVATKINPYFLCYFFNSTFGKKLVLGNLNGAAQKHFNVGTAKKVKIPLPSISVQQAIIQKLDDLSVQTKKLEDIYQQKVVDLEELKKSILDKAFKGEL